jgi:hypothetical protein
MKTYIRRVSGFERIKLVSNELCPPYANQLVIEGTGAFTPGQWRDAVADASEFNPGSRLVLRTHRGRPAWVDSGRTPPVREADGSRWSGFDSSGADFLLRSFSPRLGPTCEVVLIDGTPLRIAFRSLHAVMDMRGMLNWVEDIFRGLRNEPMQGASSTVTDFELCRSVRNARQVRDLRIKPDCLPVTAKTAGAGSGFEWRRLRLRGRYSSLLPQVALLVARTARQRSGGKVRFVLPVDLRRNRPDIRSTGNLTRGLFVEVGPETTIKDVTNDIRGQLEAVTDCFLPPGRQIVENVPLWVFRWGMKKFQVRAQSRDTCIATAVLSNINRMGLEGFQGGGFCPTGYFAIPPITESISCFIGLMGYGDFVEIVVSMPEAFSGNGRIDGFCDVIRSGLVAKPGTGAT